VVTLLSGGAPGGAARLEAALPGGGSMTRFLDYLTAAAGQAGVTLRPDAATAAGIAALRPDDVILATGATMTQPRGPAGEGRDLRQVLRAPPPGGRVAVLYDHDHTAATYAAAEWLAARYERLVLVTPREGIAQDVPLLSAQGIHRRLARLGVEIRPYRVPLRQGPGEVVLRHLLTEAEEVVRDVDLFTWSTPRVPRQNLLAPLQQAGLRVRLVGDALAPRLMLSAIREGAEAGAAL
jgi:hypothetical protein